MYNTPGRLGRTNFNLVKVSSFYEYNRFYLSLHFVSTYRAVCAYT